jgi:hypothetical protein
VSVDFSAVTCLGLLALKSVDRVLGLWMVVLFDVTPLHDQPPADRHERDEQENETKDPAPDRHACSVAREAAPLGRGSAWQAGSVGKR